MSNYEKTLLSDVLSNHYINKSNYLNRDLNWMEFNKRVLHQVVRKEVPLAEKVNFLAISMSNLDEFIMVRFAGVVNNLLEKHKSADLTGLTTEEEYFALLESIKRFKDHQKKSYKLLESEMNKEGIKLCKFDDLNSKEKKYIRNIFHREIFPLLTPINFNTTNEFPDLVSKQLNIVTILESDDREKRTISFIPLNSNLKKIYRVCDTERSSILLEDIIYAFLECIYYGRHVIEYGTVRLLREYDIELDHDEDSYITDRMKENLLYRKYSMPVFMEFTGNISDNIVKIIRKVFELNKHHVYKTKHIADYSALREIDFNKKEKYHKFDPQYPIELVGDTNIFRAIDDDDMLLHHPYESYDPILNLLESASKDPEVIAIRQTLYRVSSKDSPIINYLCDAAKNGKDVSVLLEIKARFDEQNNISLIEQLKSSGCRLLYGNEELKTHCKFMVIVKKHNNKIKIYSHIGTGNYNEKTSKIYTDISYITANKVIGEELIKYFNVLSGLSEFPEIDGRLYFSPYRLKRKIIELIDNEIRYEKQEGQSGITLKMNSITDKDIIDKLYEASEKGVKITIFCRGICTMKPINNNIKIISIVGRYLEHSRIYYFNNNGKPRIFISSADLMVRNLCNRYELMVEITSKNCKFKLMMILGLYYNDKYNSYIMSPKGKYEKVKGDDNIHEMFMEKAIENYKLKNIPKFFSKNMK